jgi:hypothetical protein
VSTPSILHAPSWRHRALAEALERTLDRALPSEDREEARFVASALLRSPNRDERMLACYLEAIAKLLGEPAENDFLHLHLLEDVLPFIEPAARVGAIYARLVERVVPRDDLRFILRELVEGWVRARDPAFADDPRLRRLDEEAAARLGYATELATF